MVLQNKKQLKIALFILEKNTAFELMSEFEKPGIVHFEDGTVEFSFGGSNVDKNRVGIKSENLEFAIVDAYVNLVLSDDEYKGYVQNFILACPDKDEPDPIFPLLA